MSKPVSSFSVIVATSVFGVAFIISAALIARGYEKSKDYNYQNALTVTGQADKVVESDTAKWSLTLSRGTQSTTTTAADLLKKDVEALRDYVKAAHIDDADFSLHPLNEYGYDGDYQQGTKYSNASQIIVIETKHHAAALGELAQSAANDLSKKGIALTNQNTEFYVSDLDTVEKSLAHDAVKDADEQAHDLVGSAIDKLQSLSAITYQVSPESSSSYQYDEDATSLKKKVTATVTAAYKLK